MCDQLSGSATCDCIAHRSERGQGEVLFWLLAGTGRVRLRSSFFAAVSAILARGAH